MVTNNQVAQVNSWAERVPPSKDLDSRSSLAVCVQQTVAVLQPVEALEKLEDAVAAPAQPQSNTLDRGLQRIKKEEAEEHGKNSQTLTSCHCGIGTGIFKICMLVPIFPCAAEGGMHWSCYFFPCTALETGSCKLLFWDKPPSLEGLARFTHSCL